MMTARSAIFGVTIATIIFPAGLVAARPVLSGTKLDPAAEEVLLEILDAANLGTARVSSYKRSARDQARIFYDIVCKNNTEADVKKLYSKAAHPVIEIYYKKRKTADRDEVISLMEKEIKEIIASLGNERRTMMHIESSNHAFDIAPSSLKDTGRFTEALKAHPDVVRYFEPGKAEAAFHIEVSKKQKPVTGTWKGTCSFSFAPAEKFTGSLRIERTDKGYKSALSFDGETEKASNTTIDKKRQTIKLEFKDEGETYGFNGTLARPYNKMTLTYKDGGDAFNCEFSK